MSLMSDNTTARYSPVEIDDDIDYCGSRSHFHCDVVNVNE
jgi:hypothetical protein